MTSKTLDSERREAIDAAIGVLDSQLFKALQEPARVAVLRQVLLLGRADVGQIAEALPQERSVISRHLQQLHEAGIVQVERAGRHRIYQVDGVALMAQFEAILQQMRKLAPFCCPAGQAG